MLGFVSDREMSGSKAFACCLDSSIGVIGRRPRSEMRGGKHVFPTHGVPLKTSLDAVYGATKAQAREGGRCIDLVAEQLKD